ncbi:MAG: hypothetical protein MI974_04490 [Chitinophagales bacterium]|nr:hypothetical protein [Chitinophagales bacterium]
MTYSSKMPGLFLVLLCIGIFSGIFFSCEPSIEEPPVTEVSPPTEAQKRAMFYFAWLADCTADTPVPARSLGAGVDSLQKLGMKRMKGALTDSIITSAIGNYGTQPVWGPYIKGSFPGNDTVLTDNLLYAVKQQTAPNEVTYVVGVSGTNMISYYGWFDEDFNVQGHQPWKDPHNVQHGSISDGSANGLSILLSLKDGNKKNILEFLQNETSNTSTTYKIACVGHSLGGALSPILALYMKERITASNVKVEAWPYAGPTPGDTDFATYLASKLDAYHPINNSLDVIPHAWEMDSLDRLCDIYVNLSDTCKFWRKEKEYAIEAGTITSGLVSWARGQSKKSGIKYQIAGNPITFEGQPMPADPGFCDTMIFAPKQIKKESPAFYNSLKNVAEQCGSKHSKVNHNISLFLVYLAELGYQHTTAYTLEFFQPESLRNAVHKHVPGSEGNKNKDAPYSGEVIMGLLDSTYVYLKRESITNCNCPD